MSAAEAAGRPIATNRKAFHDYFILRRLEAGIALRGSEVKSIRLGHITLAGGFARFEGRNLVLHVHIPPYECGGAFNHDPERPRNLLLHKNEMTRLRAELEQKGLTLIPLSCYFKKGKAKIELGLCRGKKHADRREDIRRKAAERDAARAVSRRR